MLNYKSIGNKIATARKSKNLSQAELAQQVFISSQAVGKWERGESMPDITTLNRLAEILGVDLNYFSDNFQTAYIEVDDSEFVGEKAIEKKKQAAWDMSRGNWVDADFSGLKNLVKKFSSSNMKSCQFIGSDLSELLLRSNDVVSCDFSKSNISQSKIQLSNLFNNLFIDCSLENTEFSRCDISNCDFTDANFTGAEITGCDMGGNIVNNIIWDNTSFKGCDMKNIVFDGVLKDCSFVNCNLSKVSFRNVKFVNTFFKGINLKRTQFIECKSDAISYAFLKNGKANLTDVTLIE